MNTERRMKSKLPESFRIFKLRMWPRRFLNVRALGTFTYRQKPERVVSSDVPFSGKCERFKHEDLRFPQRDWSARCVRSHDTGRGLFRWLPKELVTVRQQVDE